jgi:hypothetical protein
LWSLATVTVGEIPRKRPAITAGSTMRWLIILSSYFGHLKPIQGIFNRYSFLRNSPVPCQGLVPVPDSLDNLQVARFQNHWSRCCVVHVL